MLNRRAFLKNGSLAFVTLGFAPAFVARTVEAARARQKVLVDRVSERLPGHLIGVCENTRLVHFPWPDTGLVGKFAELDIADVMSVLALRGKAPVWVED